MFRKQSYQKLFPKSSTGPLVVIIACKDSRAKVLDLAVEYGVPIHSPKLLVISLKDAPYLADDLAALVPRSTRRLGIDDIDHLLPESERTPRGVERFLRELDKRIGIPNLEFRVTMTMDGPLRCISLDLGNSGEQRHG